MGRSQANLQFGIFRSLRGLSAEAKLLYVEILVEPTVNQAGVGARRVDRWARELELDPTVVDKALDELDDGEFVVVDVDTDEILVRTLVRNDGVAEQPNVLRAALRAAVMCESPRLRRVLAAELRKLPPPPPPKKLDSGRMFHHPDPHATAAELDPGPPDDPRWEPLPNPSGTLPEPSTDPSDSPDSRNPSGTLPGRVGGGGGGGGGGKVTSGATHLSKAAAAASQARTHARAHPRASRAEHVPSTELAATAGSGGAYALVAGWATAQTHRPASGHRRKLIPAVDKLLRQGADPTLLPAALDEAHQARFRDPVAALPLAYEDVRRRSAPQPASGIDARIAAFLADQPPPAQLPPRLRAVGGVA